MTLRDSLDVAYVLWGEHEGKGTVDAYLAAVDLTDDGAAAPQRSLEEDIEAWGESPDAQAALRTLVGDERLSDR